MTPDPTARLRLDVALDQLLNPEQQQLDRDHAATKAALTQLDDDHLATIREHRSRHAYAAHHHNPAGMRRAIDAMTRAGHQWRQQRARLTAALAATTAALPPLLEQLLDAVHSSTSTGGPAGAGAHRSPIGLDAAELLARIRHHTGIPATHHLTELRRWWAPTDLAEAADLAETWVADARALLNPRRTLEAKAPCPVCGNRHAWVLDTATGERVRRAAIQIDYATGAARCIAPSCTGYWPRERIDLLVAVLREG